MTKCLALSHSTGVTIWVLAVGLQSLASPMSKNSNRYQGWTLTPEKLRELIQASARPALHADGAG